MTRADEPTPGIEPGAPGAPLGEGPDRFLNRELSWLEFNGRVLALAEDSAQPLLERAKFLAIFASNLDEFFQVRVSGLREQVDAGLQKRTPDGMTPTEQLVAIRKRVVELVERHSAVFQHELLDALRSADITFVTWADLDDADRARLEAEFEEHIYPVLTPLAVDPAHPFPYISNLSLNLAVLVRDPFTGDERFARIKVPPLLPRFVAVDDGHRFVPLEHVIAAFVDRLFPGMEVISHHTFRVTRDADIELAEEADDLLAAIEVSLKQRTKFGQVVRLEIGNDMSDELLELLCRELELSPNDVYIVDAPLDLTGLWGVYAADRPELKDPVWTPHTPAVFESADGPVDMFRVLRQTDVLVHHPYDSFSASVEAFIDQAARDPNVLAIKQTIYRTAGPDSAVVRSLIAAAERGKQVVALVELKARFDEQANIERARVLEEAGVHVVYGLVGLKTHSKILLVVRQEADGIRRYCHIGTGNYNPKTAGIYEDLGLLTSDPELGADLTELFNHLTGYSHQTSLAEVIVAPTRMRIALLERIRAQSNSNGRITLKMNSLVDPEMIDALYDASRAGATVELIVRGICCLRPGIPGVSDNISVRSLVGRFLEHSRIYRFGPDPDAAEYLIGSADLMPRNLDRRVEALTPVRAARLRRRLDEILATNLADDVLAWELHATGSWSRIPTTIGVNTHERLMERARSRAGRADTW
ncbi:MAG: RNA degradosome polyphosphate kinase [Acidimicrobiia bacterium]